MIATSVRWLVTAALLLAACATPQGAQIQPPPPPLRAGDEDADTSADDPALPRNVATAGAQPVRSRLVLLERDAWAARTVCELQLRDAAPSLVEWRALPVAVFNDIRSGKVPDALRAYVDGEGIVDCGRPGCWVALRADARGCGLVCDSQQQVCALPPATEAKP